MSTDKVKLAVGQDVMVYQRSPGRGSFKVRPAKVVSIARVWCKIEATDGEYPSDWNMRLDSQNEGSSYSYGQASFRTMEQHEQWQRHANASAFLREEGIDLRPDSKWATAKGRIKLADLIRGSVDDTGTAEEGGS